MIKVHLFSKWRPILSDAKIADEFYDEYSAAYRSAFLKWGDRMRVNTTTANHYELWLEFDTEEDAALFKLTYL